MSESFSDDRPLFSPENSEPDTTSQNNIAKSNTTQLEVIETEADIKRQDKILSFSFTLIKYFLVASGLLVLLDVVFKKIGVADSLATDFFELLKYSITSILGYLFASERKK